MGPDSGAIYKEIEDVGRARLDIKDKENIKYYLGVNI